MNALWKKKLVNAGWLALSVVGLVLLVAAVARKNKKICAGFNVEIKGNDDHFFVDEKEVAKLLNANGELTGETIESINLLVLEKRLETDKWIRNAELFFDNNEVLQVVVEENEPIARIFTVGGYSYYIDSTCKKLPLSVRLSARVPMFTNFPSDRTRLGRVDSTMMASLKDMALYINSNPFWKAQVAQIDIDENRQLEMVPTVGNHTILLGEAEDFEQKFNRLFTFYKQVWTKVGLEKYEKLDVQYAGQVIATRRGSSAGVIDSAKAKQALDELMAKMKSSVDPDLAKNAGGDANKKPLITTCEQPEGIAATTTVKREQPNIATQKPALATPANDKTNAATQQVKNKRTVVKPAARPVLNSKVTNKIPKAVMKKKEKKK
jgi:cell division protein FtsQ